MLLKELDSGGFYKTLLEHIEHGNVHTAAEMIIDLDEQDRLAILFRLARALARALAHTHELELDNELGFDLSLARALTRALDSSLALVRERAQRHDLTRTTSLAFDLARTLARARARAHDQKLAYALAHAADYVEVTVLVLQRPTDMVTLAGLDVLTPHTLATHVVPPLQALATLQATISQLEGSVFSQPRIVYISHEALTEIRVEGVARALEVLKRYVFPQWHEYTKQNAALEIEEKQLNANQLQYEVQQMMQNLHRTRRDEPLLSTPNHGSNNAAYTDLARKKAILQQKKIQIAASLVEQLAPHLSEAEHIAYTTQLLEALNVIFDIKLEFMT